MHLFIFVFTLDHFLKFSYAIPWTLTKNEQASQSQTCYNKAHLICMCRIFPMGTPNLCDLHPTAKNNVAMLDCFVNVGLLQVLHFDPY